MSGPSPDEQQTLQFYKIQIMQKDREIADFTAKMKKIQFKHNRQLKQLKVNKERLESLLKDEKIKSDKFSKLYQENKEQNQMLELRLAQLKKEKERQILDIQSKYNILKEEVRSYQRILPTFTFLSQIGQNINELPNYEDVFINLKSKTQEYNGLFDMHKQAKSKWEQIINNAKANEQNLKNKKNEAQKHLKEILSKFQETQELISDLRMENQQIINRNTQLQQQLQFTQQRCQSLQISLKEYQEKIEKIVQNFENDLIMKEEEVYKAYQVQMIQLQQQLRNQQSQYERKQSMFNQQIRLLQEQMTFLNNKYQAEIQTFQEHYLSIKEQTEKMKNQIINQKRKYDQLQEQFYYSEQSRKQMSRNNQQAEDKNRMLEHKISIYQSEKTKIKIKSQENQINRFNDLQKNYEDLLEKMKVISAQVIQIQQQRDRLQQQNFLLRQQISNKELQKHQSKSFLFDLSKAVENFEDKMRKKSFQVEKNHQKKEIDVPTVGRDRRNSFYQGSQLLKDLQKERQFSKVKIQQIQQLKQEWDLQKQQNSILKEKLIQLNKINNEYQKNAYGNSTKNSIQKTKIDSLEGELKLLNEQNKREKQTVKRLKEEIKGCKQANIVERERLNKQMKQVMSQLQSIKIQRDKLRIQIGNKQRLLTHESNVVKNSRQLQQKWKQQAQQLRKQNKSLGASLTQLQAKEIKYQGQIHQLNKEIERLNASLKQTIKQAERTHESLLRQRKERSLLTVPSLHFINQENQQAAFNQIYASIPQKEGQINLLQRQILDLKEQMDTIKITQAAKLQALECQSNEYIQTIIEMKMRCAQSQMKASQKQHLYMQLKKKMNTLNAKDNNFKSIKS